MQCRHYKMAQKIEHTGIITEINNGEIKVQIAQLSACSSCHAKNACTASDTKDKIITVETTDTNFKIGDFVSLSGSTSIGLLAVLIAFIIPFSLILVCLLILNQYDISESLSGTISLGTLIPYYLIVSLYNQKLKRKLKFTIVKI